MRRYAGDGGGGVVGTGGDDLELGDSEFGGEVGAELAEAGGAGDDFGKDVARELEGVDEFIGPLAGARIVKLEGAGHGDFDFWCASREEIIEGVADTEEELRGLKARGIFGGELEKRVDGHELDAGFAEDFGPGGAGVGDLDAAFGAGVAVVVDRFLQFAGGIE